MGEVNRANLDPKHVPKLSIVKGDGIPLIDLSPMTMSGNIPEPKAMEGLVRKLGNTCRHWELFKVIKYGV